MWNIADVDTSLRTEHEISATAVREFYGTKEHFFDEAIDAIVAGCVTEYSFDVKEKRFVGTVTSFDGSKSYEVKVFVADDFTIRSTFCECRERVCCHVGALALHSGFNTPIFSYLPETETTTFAHGDTVKNPADEMCNRNEIEFVKVEQIENDQDESTTLDADDDSEIEEHVPIEQIYVDGNNFKINLSPDNSVVRTSFQTEQLKSNSCNEKKITERQRNIEWKKTRRLILTSYEWLIIFDAQKNHFKLHSMHILMVKLNSQFGNSSCELHLERKYPIYHQLRFNCIRNGCSRKYRLTLLRKYEESECYEFEVWYTGEIEHDPKK